MTKVNREQLLAVLQAVSPGLSPAGVIEQSQCFVFRKGKVYTYNDEEMCYAPCPLEGVEGAVPARPLLQVLEKLKEEEVGIELREGELKVSGKGRAAGVTMSKEVLLPIDKVERPKEWHKVSDQYGDAVLLAYECAGRSEKDIATAVVHFAENWVEAFDNYQMLRHRLKTKAPKNTIIKAKSAKAAAEMAPHAVAFTDNWMFFRNGNGLVVGCRKYVGEFFDLSSQVKIEGTPVNLPKGLAHAADVASTFSSENKDDNVVTVSVKRDELRITARGVSGWYREKTAIKHRGPELSFVISPKVLCQIVEKHNTCLVTKDRLKVDGGAWVYCTVLGAPQEEK